MGLIRRTYTFLDETSFRYLFQALVRPNLEYAAAVWSPYIKKDIELIENVQTSNKTGTIIETIELH